MINPTELRRYNIGTNGLSFYDPEGVWVAYEDVAAAARRAQPEGEAPQAGRVTIVAECEMFGTPKVEQDARDRIDAQHAATLSPLCGAQHAESGKEEMADRIRKLEAIVLGSCEDLGALHNAFGFDPADPIDTDRMICWLSDMRAQQAAEAKKDARPAGYLTPSQFERLGLGRVAEILPVESGGKGKTAVYFAAQLDGGQEGSESNG